MQRQLSLLLLLMPAPPLCAQTTGVAHLNDLRIATQGSGAASCADAVLQPGGGPTTVEISASSPGLPVFLFVSASLSGASCCTPCTLPLAPACGALPFSACGGGSNQSLDLSPFAPCISLAPLIGATVSTGGGQGVYTATFPLPPEVSFSIQGVLLDPSCATPSLGVLFTQAHRVSTETCPDSDGDGFTICDGDCDDADPAVNPGAPEACDGKDSDCDGFLPQEEVDGDFDGQSPCQGDCNDDDPFVWLGAPEICDGKDNDCDFQVDEDGVCGG